MRFVACIGSRALIQSERELCAKIGELLVYSGYCIKSGNARGADQSYAKGANLVDPNSVYIYLPWKSYNQEDNAIVGGNNVFYKPEKEWFLIAANHHPYWDDLKLGGKSLHARNVGIVKDVEFVVAFPNKGYGGGTAMGMRLAASNGIKVYNLRDEKDFEFWKSLVM